MEIILFVSELFTCRTNVASFKFVQVKYKIQAGSLYVCISNRPINGFTVLLKGVYFCFGIVKSVVRSLRRTASHGPQLGRCSCSVLNLSRRVTVVLRPVLFRTVDAGQCTITKYL
jgi:hypothetical protein